MVALMSASSEMIPFFLALAAYREISVMYSCSLEAPPRKTFKTPAAAPLAAERGKPAIVAPIVPPKTIMAAVGCRIDLMLPPSSACPMRTAPIPRTRPMMEARSNRTLRGSSANVPRRLPFVLRHDIG